MMWRPLHFGYNIEEIWQVWTEFFEFSTLTGNFPGAWLKRWAWCVSSAAIGLILRRECDYYTTQSTYIPYFVVSLKWSAKSIQLAGAFCSPAWTWNVDGRPFWFWNHVTNVDVISQTGQDDLAMSLISRVKTRSLDIVYRRKHQVGQHYGWLLTHGQHAD